MKEKKTVATVKEYEDGKLIYEETVTTKSADKDKPALIGFRYKRGSKK